MFSVLSGAGYFALADSAGEAGQRMSVNVTGVVEGVARLVLAVVALQSATLEGKKCNVQ